MTDLSKIKARIAAVLAKATSTTSQAEAETFLQKARDLMEQYQIDSVDVESNGQPADPLGTSFTNWFQPNTPAAEKYECMAAVARFFGCKVMYFGTSRRRRVDIHGSEAARATFEMMFPFVWKQILDLSKRGTTGTTQAYRRRLQRDITRALILRVTDLYWKAKAEREAKASAGTGTALVLVGLDTQLDAFVQDFYGVEIQKSKVSKKQGPSDYARGLAETISLDLAVGGEGGGTEQRQIGV